MKKTLLSFLMMGILAGKGTHVNVSGGGMATNAPHKAEAIKLLEFLATDEAQAYFVNGNNEFTVVSGVKLVNQHPNLTRCQR